MSKVLPLSDDAEDQANADVIDDLRLATKSSGADPSVPKYRIFPSFRFAISVLLSFSFLVMNLNFFSLSICLPCMVNSTAVAEQEQHHDPSTTIFPSVTSYRDHIDSNISTNEFSSSLRDYIITFVSRKDIRYEEPDEKSCAELRQDREDEGDTGGYHGTFVWSQAEQSYVLSGTGFGGFMCVLASGVLVDKIGPRRLQTIGLLLMAVLTALIPVTVKSPASWGGLMAIRFLMGVSQTMGFPTMVVASTVWFPAAERSSLVSVAVTGSSVGGLIVFLIGGYFCRSTVLGWESLLYVVAVISFLAAIGWYIFYSDTIEGCRWISHTEAQYIKANRGITQGAKKTKIPWKRILTSLPVLAIVIVAFTQYYMFYFIADYVVTYYKTVLLLDVTSSGILSALPLLVQSIGRFVSGPITDLLSRHVKSTTVIRIMAIISGHLPAVSILAASFFDCYSTAGAVAFISMAYFFHGFIVGGFIRSISCIAPLYAGTVTGLAQELNYLSGIVVPYASALLIGHGSASAWKHAFYLAAAIGFVGATFFTIFGSGELQPWSALAEENRRISLITTIPNIEDIIENRTNKIRRESVYSEVAFQ